MSLQTGETKALDIALAIDAERLDPKSLSLCMRLGCAKKVVGTDGQCRVQVHVLISRCEKVAKQTKQSGYDEEVCPNSAHDS
jgi:hypothetical protein